MWASGVVVRGEGGRGALTYLEFRCSVKRTEREINSLLLSICSTHRFENLITSLGLPLQSIFAPYFLKEHAPSLLFLKKSAHKTQIIYIFSKHNDYGPPN